MTTTSASTDIALRRSPMHEAIDRLHPVWKQFRGMLAPIHFGDAAGESAKARSLGLCDISSFPRMGVKGKSAESWLSSRGLPIPAEIYGHVRIEDGGGTIFRTGSTEFLVEDDIERPIVDELLTVNDSSQGGVYRFRRSDAVMYLTGSGAIDVFTQTSGYHFREPDAKLVYTRVAGVSCGILTLDRYPFPVYQIWCDGTFGGYLWEQLDEIGREHGGAAVGLATFFPSFRTELEHP